jgi:hypothetical protein
VAVVAVQESERLLALEVAEALRATGHRPVFAAGGCGARWDGRGARWDGALEAGIVVLPDRINEAAVVARHASGSVAAR